MAAQVAQQRRSLVCARPNSARSRSDPIGELQQHSNRQQELDWLVVGSRGGWCLLLAVYAPFTRELRAVCVRVRSVCAPCKLRVRPVYTPCTLLFTSGFVRFMPGYVRFTSGLPAVYIRPACVGCSFIGPRLRQGAACRFVLSRAGPLFGATGGVRVG